MKKRIKLADRILPNYSLTEERLNYITHIIGGILGIIVLVLCVAKTALKGNTIVIISSFIYGVTMIMLYTISSVYHGLKPSMAKKVMQVLDHCTIYLLIAGTYTPIALCAFLKTDSTIGWIIMGIEWGLAALSIVLTAIDLKKYSVFSMTCYITMGWMVIIFAKQAMNSIGMEGFMLLLLGGILYTLGAVLYVIGKKKKYIHSVFHVFVLLGSLFHFFSIYFFIL